MQIANELQQVCIGINQQRVVALLKEVPTVTLASMDTPGILTAEPLHESSDGHVGDLQDKMDRIYFPTKRMHPRTTAREHGRKKPFENRIVGGIGKDRLTGVTALYDVVNPAGYVKSGST